MERGERDRILLELQPLVSRMARYIASQVYRVEADDLISAANIALLESLEKDGARGYDPARGSLNTWMKLRIRGAMLDYMRGNCIVSGATLLVREKRAPAIVSLSKRKHVDRSPAESTEWVDFIPSPGLDPEQQAASAEVIHLVRKAVGKLETKRRKVIEILLDADMAFRSQRGVVTILGVTQSRVSQIKTSAYRNLRRTLKAAA